ncbi:hypothetical protein PF006_g30330 [Phytophthora fragariae]|uniref:Uncharacterized protein n=1 Tax=Phytophthora fragariae TaxID=53985 RepID=A0A6A3PZT6_9STRA|nr:hypothetical protein PF003_g19305 [Phytophthora fragariae]KAE8918827.1 hypothetical protein PF009_g30861 [Phytophthora fragariae]KAE9066021.1 hypothetical protein PF006_g30330 [Phytophthora fragariae]
MPVWPLVSAGSSKVKPMLTERQQSTGTGTGKLIKGADAEGAGLTR